VKAALVAGAVAGTVVLGFGGRLVMAAVRTVHGFPAEWSLAGTAQVVIPGATLGPAAGMLYALLRTRVPLPGRALSRGLIFGAIHALVWVAVYLLRPAGPIELIASPFLGSALFALLLLAFGVAVALLEERWRSRLERVPLRAPVAVAAVLMASAGFLFTLWILLSR
jgi:hypothetical protein